MDLEKRKFEFNGNPISFLVSNGDTMINLTDMARSFPEKNLSTIVNSKEIKDYVERLAAIKNFIASDLLVVENGVGTWAHQKIALRVAQKLSTDFSIWVDTKLEELLLNGRTELKHLSQTEILLENVKILVQQEKRLNAIESKIIDIEKRTSTHPDYFTVVGYTSLHGISLTYHQAREIGKKASKICKKRGLKTDSTPDPRFGRVRMYPAHVLEEIFNTPINDNDECSF